MPVPVAGFGRPDGHDLGLARPGGAVGLLALASVGLFLAHRHAGAVEAEVKGAGVGGLALDDGQLVVGDRAPERLGVALRRLGVDVESRQLAQQDARLGEADAAGGGTEHFHQMLAANVVAPGRAQSLPLPPEFVQPQDGADKQDCERQAVKRWLRRHGGSCAAMRPVYLGDDLYACQPVCQAMLDAGGDFLLTCKQPSHKTLHEYLDGIRPPTRRRTAGRGAKRRIHRYRWMTDLPIRDGDDALRVNWLETTSARPDGTVTYRGAFVTSLDVDRGNVAELADCARARWKIENETFNVLKQHGYHLEHNFGHGRDTLASVLVVLNLLAFALHTACDLAETLWQQARQRLGTRFRLFEPLRTLAEYQVVPSWTALMTLLATGGPAAQPP